MVLLCFSAALFSWPLFYGLQQRPLARISGDGQDSSPFSPTAVFRPAFSCNASLQMKHFSQDAARANVSLQTHLMKAKKSPNANQRIMVENLPKKSHLLQRLALRSPTVSYLTYGLTKLGYVNQVGQGQVNQVKVRLIQIARFARNVQ